MDEFNNHYYLGKGYTNNGTDTVETLDDIVKYGVWNEYKNGILISSITYERDSMEGPFSF